MNERRILVFHQFSRWLNMSMHLVAKLTCKKRLSWSGQMKKANIPKAIWQYSYEKVAYTKWKGHVRAISRVEISKNHNAVKLRADQCTLMPKLTHLRIDCLSEWAPLITKRHCSALSIDQSSHCQAERHVRIQYSCKNGGHSLWRVGFQTEAGFRTQGGQ